jgi:hypothetical protein
VAHLKAVVQSKMPRLSDFQTQKISANKLASRATDASTSLGIALGDEQPAALPPTTSYSHTKAASAEPDDGSIGSCANSTGDNDVGLGVLGLNGVQYSLSATGCPPQTRQVIHCVRDAEAASQKCIAV